MAGKTQAPKVKLEAAGSGREISLDAPGAPLVLALATRETTELVPPFRAALRERFPDPEKTIIASVADTHGVPRLMRKVARGALSKRYEEMAAGLAPGQDPAAYIVILPDWSGKVAVELGIGELGTQLTVAVIGSTGEVAGTYTGDEPVEAAAELLDALGG
ncbi:MAG: hypothetical protein ACE5EF_00780 [Dehalococcoidia bacterium]